MPTSSATSRRVRVRSRREACLIHQRRKACGRQVNLRRVHRFPEEGAALILASDGGLGGAKGLDLAVCHAINKLDDEAVLHLLVVWDLDSSEFVPASSRVRRMRAKEVS